MRFKILIAIIILLSPCNSFGQSILEKKIEIGVIYSPTFTNSIQFDCLTFNNSFGVYSKYQFLKKIGIGAGISYQTQNISTTIKNPNFQREPPPTIHCYPLRRSFSWENLRQNKFSIIKTPIWLSFNMNYKSNPKLRGDLIVGYGFGKLLNSVEKENEFGLRGLVDNINFGIIGLEFQRKIVNNLKLTLGGHLEMTNIYDRKYGEIQNIKIVVRVSK